MLIIFMAIARPRRCMYSKFGTAGAVRALSSELTEPGNASRKEELQQVQLALQIIHEADKIYGVSHSNRISRIDVVTREDALEFVQANLQENEEAQGNENRNPN